jgi:hypothetical protein
MECNMRLVLAVFFAGLLELGLCHAQAQQQPSTAAPEFAPVETPVIDVDLLETPQVPARAEPKKLNPDQSDKSKTELTFPNSIDLGKSKLEFDTKHSSELTARNLANDSGEASNLSKVMPGQKQERALPNYFGFTIKTPTH